MITLKNKVLMINNRRTSMRLCSDEWNALQDICRIEKRHRNQIIADLDKIPDPALGLTSRTRLFMLLYFKSLQDKSMSGNAPLSQQIIKKIQHASIS